MTVVRAIDGQNRKFLSGGAAHMVYTEFVVEARTAFGDYQPCNPDPKTGVFACDMMAGPPPPPQCDAGGNSAFMDDCSALGPNTFVSAGGRAGASAAELATTQHMGADPQRSLRFPLRTGAAAPHAPQSYPAGVVSLTSAAY